MTISIPIRYKPLWSILYLLIGITCVIIFVFAAYVLNDYSLFIYVLMSFPAIYVSYIMLNKPYAIVTEKSIVVYGLLGQVRYNYHFDDKNKIHYKKSRFYYTNNGLKIKIKMNKWFVNTIDWESVIELFNTNNSNKIIKHLITD